MRDLSRGIRLLDREIQLPDRCSDPRRQRVKEQETVKVDCRVPAQRCANQSEAQLLPVASFFPF